MKLALCTKHRGYDDVVKAVNETGLSLQIEGLPRKGPRTLAWRCLLNTGETVAAIRRRLPDIATRLGLTSVSLERHEGNLFLLTPQEAKPFGLFDLLEHSGMDREGIPVGLDIFSQPIAVRLAAMPHCLVAGQTGSGKSVALDTMILGLMALNNPKDLRMILVDPKWTEFTKYRGMPHLACPPIHEAHLVPSILIKLCDEMNRRYERLATGSADNLNNIVLIVDELADLISGSNGDETKNLLLRLAQKGRAAGIHLILATQRPSVKVLPGDLKANLPTRLGLKCASGTDSKVVLDHTGAENLLGNGDALLVYEGKTVRVQVPLPSQADFRRIHAHYVDDS